MTAPTLHTDRLTLRAPRLADFDHWAAFFASPRSVHEGGPKTRLAAWQHWAADVALWTLKGYGPFGVDDRATGAYMGEVGIYHGEGYPAPELGWFVVPKAEGKGVALEAARTVLAWVRTTFDWPHITNIIEPANTRSIALGLRLGGVIDATLPGIDPGDVVIRHDLRRVAAEPNRSPLAAQRFSLAVSGTQSDARSTASEERIAPTGRRAVFPDRKTKGRQKEDAFKTSEKGK